MVATPPSTEATPGTRPVSTSSSSFFANTNGSSLAAAESSINYGFVIDNRRCIGCHACTVACKSEHQDPIGINKTWVTYLEKGVYPDTKRAFHVMRCNHCADAPCVEICPTASLETRADGIVDFDPSRCIGCKACMQACPYDAITINPDSGTATKCNYCAHRVDNGRVPACVAVCPAEAIIVGDLEDAESPIARLIATETTMVRKPEKGTQPNLFYIEGDRAALEPSASVRSTTTLWGFRKSDAVDAVVAANPQPAPPRDHIRRTYDIAQRHAGSWGWKVSAYLFTKSIAAGAFLVPGLAALFGQNELATRGFLPGIGLALLFLAITGLLLVVDLKRPERFLWVLFRPQWRSWLVRGAYIITAYGGFLTLFAIWNPQELGTLARIACGIGVFLAAATAAYSGWLFGQAKGRDFWQSPLVPVHLTVQAAVAGVCAFTLLAAMTDRITANLTGALIVGLVANFACVASEIWGRHATQDAKRAAKIMTTGHRGQWFRFGVLGVGHAVPLVMLAIFGVGSAPLAAVTSLAGLWIYEHLWIDAPQRVPLA